MRLSDLTEYEEYGNNKENVDVSIWCITYNHVDYIRKTFEGFLSQRTNFNIEVLVYDDASTDGTSDIVREYAIKYPGLIHAFISKNNLFKHPDRKKVLHNLKLDNLTGKYIAVCEGDDYWIDSEKLQYQYEFMEQHPECSLFIHNAFWIDYRRLEIKVGNPFDGDNRFLTDDELVLIEKKHPPTASFFYKRELLEQQQFMYNAPVGDYTLMLYASYCGKVYYTSRILSVYRYMTHSSSSKLMQNDRGYRVYFVYGMILFLHCFDKFSENRYQKWIKIRLTTYYYILSNIAKSDTSISMLIDDCRKLGWNIIYSEETINSIEKLRRQLYLDSYLSEELKDFINNYDKIYIFGAGDYAKKIANQLKKNGIFFEAFLVSDLKKEWYMERPVFHLDNKYNSDNIGIIVGISPLKYSNIKQSLEQYKIENYICPFEIDLLNID